MPHLRVAAAGRWNAPGAWVGEAVSGARRGASRDDGRGAGRGEWWSR